MEAQCSKHQFDPASDFCAQCAGPFCARCLVYPFGERRPPMCIPCALVASGVRHGKRPKATWKERREQRKAARRAGAPEPLTPEEEAAQATEEAAEADAQPFFAGSEPSLAEPLGWEDPAGDPDWDHQPLTAPSWRDSSWNERSWSDEQAESSHQRY